MLQVDNAGPLRQGNLQHFLETDKQGLVGSLQKLRFMVIGSPSYSAYRTVYPDLRGPTRAGKGYP